MIVGNFNKSFKKIINLKDNGLNHWLKKSCWEILIFCLLKATLEKAMVEMSHELVLLFEKLFFEVFLSLVILKLELKRVKYLILLALKIVEIFFYFWTKIFTNVFDFFVIFLIDIVDYLCYLIRLFVWLKYSIVYWWLVLGHPFKFVKLRKNMVLLIVLHFLKYFIFYKIDS